MNKDLLKSKELNERKKKEFQGLFVSLDVYMKKLRNYGDYKLIFCVDDNRFHLAKKDYMEGSYSVIVKGPYCMHSKPAIVVDGKIKI